MIQPKTISLLMTDNCNLKCSFCCRRNIAKSPQTITIAQAHKSMEWILDNCSEDVTVHFWGGEPTLAMDVMKDLLCSYPQIQFVANTNGIVVNDNKDILDFMIQHAYHFNLQLSISIAYDMKVFDDYFIRFEPLLKVIGQNRWCVNLVLLQLDKFVERIDKLYSFGIHQIVIDFPLHAKIDESYIEQATKVLLELCNKYKDKSPCLSGSGYNFGLYKLAINQSILEQDNKMYCGSGINRILIDYDGNLWGCDGMYELKHKSIGTLDNGFNDNINFFKDLSSNHGILCKDCINCEFEKNCIRPKCLVANELNSGSFYKIDKDWCKCNQALMNFIKQFQGKKYGHTRELQNIN